MFFSSKRFNGAIFSNYLVASLPLVPSHGPASVLVPAVIPLAVGALLAVNRVVAQGLAMPPKKGGASVPDGQDV